MLLGIAKVVLDIPFATVNDDSEVVWLRDIVRIPYPSAGHFRDADDGESMLEAWLATGDAADDMRVALNKAGYEGDYNPLMMGYPTIQDWEPEEVEPEWEHPDY